MSATTANEYWQLQGSGASVGGLTKLVSDGNARLSATRIGTDAGTANAGRVQFYYGPMASPSLAVAVAVGNAVASAGGCAPTLVIGVEGDTTGANLRIKNARQNKLAFPTQSDWRWDGAPGAFMVFTTDSVASCSAVQQNHGYAVWDGTRWNLQYRGDGCPKLFTSLDLQVGYLTIADGTVVPFQVAAILLNP